MAVLPELAKTHLIDLDAPGLGFLGFLKGKGQDAVLEAGVDVVLIHVPWQAESCG
jgi:hypothetical protein